MTDDQRAWRAPLSLVALVANAFTGLNHLPAKGALFEMDDKPGQQGLLMTHKQMSAVRVMRHRPKN